MSVYIYTIIDDDITIHERVEGNVYQYLNKIVETYREHDLIVYLGLYTEETAYYIKIYKDCNKNKTISYE